MLPAAVLRRAKALLAGNPVLVHYQQGAASRIEQHEPCPAQARYVSPDQFPLKLDRGDSAGKVIGNQLPLLSLDRWLRQQGSGTSNPVDEGVAPRSAGP
jgi:hypothetical protein